MNKSRQLIFQTLAAGAAGVAFFSLANAPFTAALRGDVIIGLGATAALLGLAVFDYSRKARPLCVPGRLLRPTLAPACTAPGRAEDCRRNDLAA